MKPEITGRRRRRLLLKEPESTASHGPGGVGAATNSLNPSSECCYVRSRPVPAHRKPKRNQNAAGYGHAPYLRLPGLRKTQTTG